MEFLPESLGRVLQSGGPMQIERAAQFATQIAEGLGAAHALGIVHRDIKPQNVLIGVDGTAKVTDFGIARADILTTMTATGAMMGTPHYMSPEQARGEHAEVPSDVYSLGCVLYQMLAGELPFKGDTPLAIVRQQIDEQPTPLRRLRREVPRELADLVDRAMAKDATKRFQNGAEMASALRDAVPSIAEPVVVQTPTDPPVATAPPAPAPPVERRPPRARRALFTLAIGILIAIVVAAVAAVPLLLGPTPGEEPQAPVALPQREPEAAIAKAAEDTPTAIAIERAVRPARPPAVVVPVAPGEPAILVSPLRDVIVELDAAHTSRGPCPACRVRCLREGLRSLALRHRRAGLARVQKAHHHNHPAQRGRCQNGQRRGVQRGHHSPAQCPQRMESPCDDRRLGRHDGPGPGERAQPLRARHQGAGAHFDSGSHSNADPGGDRRSADIDASASRVHSDTHTSGGASYSRAGDPDSNASPCYQCGDRRHRQLQALRLRDRRGYDRQMDQP